MKTTSSLAKLIAFAVATLLATGTLAATIANVQFGDKATYKAVFEDVTGVAAGQEVRIAGVRVGDREGLGAPRPQQRRGRVHGGQDQRPDAGHGRDREVPQPRGGALPRPHPGVGDSAALEDGATIGLDTQSALDLTVLFNGFKPLFAALSPKDVNEFSAEIIAVLQGGAATSTPCWRRPPRSPPRSPTETPSSAGRSATSTRCSPPSTSTTPR